MADALKQSALALAKKRERANTPRAEQLTEWLKAHAPAEQLAAWRRWGNVNGRHLTAHECADAGYSYKEYTAAVRKIGRPRKGDDQLLAAIRQTAPADLASVLDL